MLIRPRLTDYYNVHVPQSEIDFAIPFLNEDIPLYVDPFLMWKSPSLQDKSLHHALISAFNNLGTLVRTGQRETAVSQLIAASECDEVGLGSSANRSGTRFGPKLASEILRLFEKIEYYQQNGLRHLEEIQLLVSGINKDRISDITCSFLKSFLIDYTIQECEELGIPTSRTIVPNVFNHATFAFENVEASVPVHPEHGYPLLFVPKRWLRHVPWISYQEYFKNHCPQDDIVHEGESLTRVKVLTYNRDNYGVVDHYIKERERAQEDCLSDPLFSQIPVLSARRKLGILKRLGTGKADNADRKYEDCIGELFASLFYPKLDFAQAQGAN